MKKQLLLYFILLSSCYSDLHKNINENAYDYKISKLSLYYSASADTLKKYIVFSDSFLISSVNLKICHFYDIRDTGNDFRYWFEGIIAINTRTGNVYCHASKYRGDILSLNNHQRVFRTDSTFPLYQDSFKKNNTVDIYSERNRGAALKLSSILNDMPIDIKLKMNKEIMDTIIRNFIFSDIGICSSRRNCHLMADSSRVDLEIDHCIRTNYRMFTTKRHFDNSSYINTSKSNLFYLYKIRSLINQENVFVYMDGNSTLLFNDCVIMITINEDLKPALSQQNFYSIFSQEPIMYDVKIYSENS